MRPIPIRHFAPFDQMTFRPDAFWSTGLEAELDSRITEQLEVQRREPLFEFKSDKMITDLRRYSNRSFVLVLGAIPVSMINEIFKSTPKEKALNIPWLVSTSLCPQGNVVVWIRFRSRRPRRKTSVIRTNEK